MIHLNIWLWCNIGVRFIFSYGYTVISGLFDEKVFLSPLDFIGSLVENQMTGRSAGLDAVVHSLICTLCQYHIVLITVDL